MKISKEVKIGLIVIVAIALFMFGFNFLKGKNILSNRIHYFVVYDNVGGLNESNPVYYNGFVVGKVIKISFTKNLDGKLYVEFGLKETELKLPKNTVARIFSDGLLGTKAVMLVMGDSKIFANSGDTLLPDMQSSLTDEMSKQFTPLKDKVENLVVKGDTLLGALNSIFTSNTKGGIRHSIENLDQITANFNGIVAEQRTRLNEITTDIESISKNIKNNNEKLSSIIANFKNISDTIAKANIAQTLNNADIAIKQTSEIMNKINAGKGTLGMLVNNDSLYKNLNSASKDLDKLLVDLKEHPKRYVHLSVFGKSDKVEKKKK